MIVERLREIEARVLAATEDVDHYPSGTGSRVKAIDTAGRCGCPRRPCRPRGPPRRVAVLSLPVSGSSRASYRLGLCCPSPGQLQSPLFTAAKTVLYISAKYCRAPSLLRCVCCGSVASYQPS